MRITGSLGTMLISGSALAIGALFTVPVVQTMGSEGFSVLDGSAPTIGAFTYFIMLSLLCISAPGLIGRVVGVVGAAASGWACGQAAALARSGDFRLASGLIIVAVLTVALAVAIMRNMSARQRRDVIRLSRRLHTLTEGTTAHLRERYHAVPLHRGGPNPLADVTLVDRLLNAVIGEASGATDREQFLKTLLQGLRDVRDDLRSQHEESYGLPCLEEHVRVLLSDIRQQGLDLPQRAHRARVVKGHAAH